MGEKINPDLLHQRWVRSYDEDTPTEEVYRPATYPVQRRARGQTGFELRPDHTVAHISIGRTDVPDEMSGSWELDEDDAPVIRMNLDTGEAQTMRISSVEKDRLVVKKAQ